MVGESSSGFRCRSHQRQRRPSACLSAGRKRRLTFTLWPSYLALQPGKAEATLELSGPVIESLFTSTGFVAVTTGGSASCNALRTLTVWESEEAMFAFVVSPAHARAMAQTSDVSRGTSNTTTWDGNAASVTWREAARQLGLEVGGDI